MAITNVGIEEVAKLIIGAGTAFSNVAIGTGTTAFDSASTTLNNEYKRDTATTSTATTDTTGDTAQFVKTFTFTESQNITEAGIFNNSTGGTLLAAQTFSAIGVADGDSLQITYKIDFD